MPDGGPDAAVTDDDDGSEDGEESGGCCRVGGGGDTGWVPGLLVALFLVGWSSRKRK